MKIDGKAAHPLVVDEWRKALSGSSRAQLHPLAVAHTNLEAGFRPGKAPLSTLIQRVQASFGEFPELPTAYRSLLQELTLSNSLLLVLSVEAIQRTAPLLARCFGQARILGALLLDDRQAVRDKGLELMDVWDGAEPSEPDMRHAAEDLAEELRPFLGHASRLLAPGAAGAPCDGPGKPTEDEVRKHRRSHERNLVLDLRAKRREVLQLQRQLRELATDRDGCRAQSQATSALLAKSRTANEGLNEVLTELRSQMEVSVAAEVDARLNDQLLPWLAPAESLAQAAEVKDGVDILDRAEQVLQRQAELDRRFGLRSKLRSELDRLEEMLARLRDAQLESLSPSAELAIAAQQVEVRITELQRVLHVTAAAPGSDKVALTKLALHLMEAVGLEQVTALRKSLQAAEPLGLLPDDELQQAYAMVRDATSRIYARTRLQCLRASNERDLRGLPLNAMQAELAQGAECSLVIDGHNVLHKLPALFRGEFQQGLPGPRARRSLEARLIALGQRHPSLSIQLWFDGPDSNHRTAIENVRVQYSGGTGANRADQEIVAYLRHVQESTPRRARAVVTADLDEALQAEATGAMVMTPQELAVWME